MNKPMRRRKPRLRERREIAYDLETTAIGEGTPEPRYLALYDGQRARGYAVHSLPELAATVVETMLTDDTVGVRFIAYNGNRFDAYLIALGLLHYPDYRCEPWLANNGNFRGMMVADNNDPKRRWYFSDPMAMYGYLGDLASFLRTFAPMYHKQHIDVLHFDATNPAHIEYALNDAVALWHATQAAGKIQRDTTGIPPQNTIGKAAVKFFESRMPVGVLVWPVPREAEVHVMRAKRGGYVYCAGRYRGKVWKYDLNQAYASAMRYPLPSGRCLRTVTYYPDELGVYRVTFWRDAPTLVPFYARDAQTTKMLYTAGEEVTAWLVSPEVAFLQETGWHVMVHDGWVWSDRFDMTALVDELEHNRLTCEGGPKGPIGYFYKAMGNNAYGKTLEQTTGMRIIVAAECPPGYTALYAEDERFNGLWFKMEGKKRDTYQRPQIGIFITAYVRIMVMTAALKNPAHFRYADTDCVVFSACMDDELWVDPGKYGAFKQEEAGEEFIFINKKVYCSVTCDENHKPLTAHAKGLHVKNLTIEDFERWYDGEPPEQTQTQRRAFLRVMGGDQMFHDMTRSGSFVLPMAAD